MTQHVEARLPTGQSRAEFMNKEGSVLFNHLTRAVIGPVMESIDAEKLISARHPGYYSDPMHAALNIVEVHDNYQNDHTNNRSIFQYAAGMYHTELAGTFSLEQYVRNYTFEKTLPRAMYEAYKTMLYFPLNLLFSAQIDTGQKRLPPVYRTFEDLPRIYRSDWFQDACNTAALTANSLWKAFSVKPVGSAGPLGSAYLDLDFDTAKNGLSTFRFSSMATDSLKSWLKIKNKDVILERAAKRQRGESVGPENFTHGTSSGCPVRHGKPGLDPDKPDELKRLEVLAAHTGVPAEQLANQMDSGISYSLAAIAGMFERCAPYVRQAQEYVPRGGSL